MQDLLRTWAGVLGEARAKPLDDAYGNNAWVVEAADGREYILKRFHTIAVGEPLLRLACEHRVLTHLHAAGVPVAVPLVTDDARLYALDGEDVYVLSPQLPGSPESPEERPDAFGRRARRGQRPRARRHEHQADDGDGWAVDRWCDRSGGVLLACDGARADPVPESPTRLRLTAPAARCHHVGDLLRRGRADAGRGARRGSGRRDSGRGRLRARGGLLRRAHRRRARATGRPLLEVALGTPAALAQTVEAGLRPEPAEWPSMAAFGTQLEAVAWQLIGDTRQAGQQDAWREVLVDLDHRSTGLK